ncbi:unannotated protein [freshwater metagenome]|uniref:Unannotated protein n=1 Tax=freshwater metagenome TaxID=449393 RepID=A0A6J6P808_9ZZZZ
MHLAECLTEVLDHEPKRTVVWPQLHSPIVRRLGQPVCDATALGCQPGAHIVVGTQHLGSSNVSEILVERSDDAVERSVVVEMIDLNVGEDRAIQRQLKMCAVALVGFDHKPVGASPLCSGTHVGDIAPDDETRTQPGFGQHQHQHARGGGLAVRAGNSERPSPSTNTGQHSGTAQHLDALLARFVELYVLRGHRCTGRDSIDAMHVGTLVANLHRNTCGAKPIEYWLLANVAARHIVTHLGQHNCDSAHARPAHANDMKALGLAEIDWRCRRHRCSAMSSMTLARRPLR